MTSLASLISLFSRVYDNGCHGRCMQGSAVQGSATTCVGPYMKYCFHNRQLIAENWISCPRLRTRLLKVT